MSDSDSSTFFGKPVRDFSFGQTIKRSTSVVHRLLQEYEAKETQQQLLADYLSRITPATLEALVIGAWAEVTEQDPQGFLDALVERQPDLTEFKALFVGDMSGEECEISWIHQGDYRRLLDAFTQLEVLRIRGSTDLKLPVFEHHTLRELAIECGGLPTAIVRNIQNSTLPSLRHLELWLGAEDYGYDGKPADYIDLLRQIRPERLRYLGLRNAPIADELATYLAQQPWLGRLHTLDLSMGTLGDKGAAALLESPHIGGLKVLDLTHHYIASKTLLDRLRALPLQLRIDEAQEEDDGERYVEVSE